MSSLDGFRTWLERATRTVEDCEQGASGTGDTSTPIEDWNVHTVDYVRFKERLRFFAQRRARLRALIKSSHDQCISEQLLSQEEAKTLPPAVAVGLAAGIDSAMESSTSSGLMMCVADTSATLDTTTTSIPTATPLRPGERIRTWPWQRQPQTSTETEQQQQHQPATDYVAFPPEVGNSNNAAASAGTAAMAQPSVNPTGTMSVTSPINISDSASASQPSEQSSSQSVNSSHRQGGAPALVTGAMNGKSKRSVMRRISNMERSEMFLFLTWEMDKVHMFYQSQWQRLSLRLEQAQQQPSGGGVSADGPDYELGDEILELYCFCVLNIVTVHQILIRYDAFARTFEGMPMMHYYIKKVTKHPSTSYRKILKHHELGAIADAYLRHVQTTFAGAAELAMHFESQRVLFRDVLGRASMTPHRKKASWTSTDASMPQYNFLTRSLVPTLRELFLLGLFEDQLGLEPAYLLMRGRSRVPEMQQLAEWRQNKKKLFVLCTHDDPGVHKMPASPLGSKQQLTDLQVFHLTLTLLSAFLYCMNYYIVEPSSTMYVNRLGAHDAMSGTLIGMMPLAAFFSSLPYSMWTNRSFRHPFLMSCFMLILGNFIYSLADQFLSVELALLGRFIAGLGAPKCIIRRYMADTTPVSLRTSVNALFGMVVAAGSAMGPAMAILLNKFEYTTVFRFMGIVTFNGLTLPGYFMMTLWITFTAIVLATFEEPDREGLEEQKRLEVSSSPPSSPINRPPAAANAPSPSREDTVDSESLPKDGTARPLLFQNNNMEPLVIAPSPSRASSTIPIEPHHNEPLVSSSSLHEHHQEIRTIFSGELGGSSSGVDLAGKASFDASRSSSRTRRCLFRVRQYLELVTLPVRLCLGLLFAKVFTIEALVSATSALSKNRYGWQVQQVGLMGFCNGLLVIPISIGIGHLSMSYQDHILMRWLVGIGCLGLFLLIDMTDLVNSSSDHYNEGHVLAVGPRRYILGYFLAYLSIQSFEGVIGSTLSKVIPTALAAGTFNSGLLATLVDTSGRACGDLFISLCGFIELRQLMNLLFVPGFCIMFTCWVVIDRFKDMLAV